MLQWIPQLNRIKKTVAIITVCLATVFSFFVFFEPALVNAQQIIAPSEDGSFGLKPFEQSTILTNQDIRVIIAKIIRALLGILGVIALGLVLYAGYIIMTSDGNEDKIGEGKKILINAIIGLAIILSAFSIVQFILNALARGTNFQGGEGGNKRINFQTFTGSSGLGRVIKDHSPLRDEENVPRNTMIAITFFEAVDPRTIIMDFNGDGIIGNCATTTNFSWETHCDRLVTSSVHIFQTSNPNSFINAVALTTYEANNSTYTFVFRPIGLPEDALGSSTTSVSYTVDILNNIKKSDGRTRIFNGYAESHYDWRFKTGTTLDLDPPTVKSIFPPAGASGIYKNSVIQINFSEPMNPITVSGLLDQTVPGGFDKIIFGNNSSNNRLTKGEWKVSNGYRTVEFTPDNACGQNSCGDTMFCFELDCSNPQNRNCVNGFTVLGRTADLIGNSSFQAVPLTGITDLANNALDANANRIPEGKPTSGGKQIREADLHPDNFYWGYSMINQIDSSAPVVRKILPNLDEEDVQSGAPLQVVFSRPMRSWTLYGVRLEEYPTSTNGVVPIWFVPRSEIVQENINGETTKVTRLNILHRVFGPNDTDLYYFPAIPSTAQSLTQNCLHPGRGPFIDNTYDRTLPSPVCEYEVDSRGVVQTNGNCVPVIADNSNLDTGCVQTTMQEQNGERFYLRPTVDSCLNTLRSDSISPLP